MPDIPKELHAIWVGSPPGDKVINNLTDWKKRNPGYNLNLWVDSATYREEEQEEFRFVARLLSEYNIRINDLSANKKDIPGVYPARAFLARMPDRQFYEDELSGSERNLAAASDILRLEILYEIGGIYFDGGDVFPGAPLPDRLDAPYGFLYHLGKNDLLNNDLLASVPHGEVISRYRTIAHDNYVKLYEDERLVQAHRRANAAGPDAYVMSANSRLQSTMSLAGPQALRRALRLSEESNPLFKEKHAGFDLNYISLPDKQDLSWFDSTASTSHSHAIPVLRNYVRSYFSLLLGQEGDRMREGSGSENDGVLPEVLDKFNQRMNSLPTNELSLSNILIDCVNDIHPEQRSAMDAMLTRLQGIAGQVDKFETYVKNNGVDPFVLVSILRSARYLSDSNGFVQPGYTLPEFVEGIFGNDDVETNQLKLESYNLVDSSTMLRSMAKESMIYLLEQMEQAASGQTTLLGTSPAEKERGKLLSALQKWKNALQDAPGKDVRAVCEQVKKQIVQDDPYMIRVLTHHPAFCTIERYLTTMDVMEAAINAIEEPTDKSTVAAEFNAIHPLHRCHLFEVLSQPDRIEPSYEDLRNFRLDYLAERFSSRNQHAASSSGSGS